MRFTQLEDARPSGGDVLSSSHPSAHNRRLLPEDAVQIPDQRDQRVNRDSQAGFEFSISATQVDQ